MNVMKWLLDSDPAIRWQVMRDLTEEDEPVVAAERSRVAAEGWGARVLGSQSPRGQWGSAAFPERVLPINPSQAAALHTDDVRTRPVEWCRMAQP
jgi:hypothetical protein